MNNQEQIVTMMCKLMALFLEKKKPFGEKTQLFSKKVLTIKNGYDIISFVVKSRRAGVAQWQSS